MKTAMLLGVVFVFLVGCMGPPKVERFKEIKQNETCFLIPLEGATKANQKQFMSVDYLNAAKVATKRISLPLRIHSTGRAWWSYEWIPTMKAICVNRMPQTREWTSNKSTGTESRDQALWVESLDSIGFGVGVNITAMIKEEDAATFLYYYAGKSLSAVLDDNIRGKVNSVLSREFAAYNLETARAKKNTIFDKATQETIDEFQSYGITISNLGLAEGMVYENPSIQKAIDDVFTSEMQIEVEDRKMRAQAKINSRILDIAKNERKAAEEFAKAAIARKKQVELEIAQKNAEARLVWAKSWKGRNMYIFFMKRCQFIKS